MHIKRWVVVIVAIFLIGMTVSQVTWAKEKPPKGKVVFEKKFEMKAKHATPDCAFPPSPRGMHTPVVECSNYDKDST